MNKLSLLFYSKVRAEVLRLLFGLRTRRMYRLEIIRHTPFAQRSVEEELRKLSDLQLLVASRDGNRVYYEANRAHPLYPDLRNIVIKTVGLGDVLREALASPKVEFAFVFGSIAELTERAESDVDLMIVGGLRMRELATALRGAADRIGRVINPHIFTRAEFASRIASRDHFLSGVLDKPKLFITGDEDEFGDMARGRMAAPAQNQS